MSFGASDSTAPQPRTARARPSMALAAGIVYRVTRGSGDPYLERAPCSPVHDHRSESNGWTRMRAVPECNDGFAHPPEVSWTETSRPIEKPAMQLSWRPAPSLACRLSLRCFPEVQAIIDGSCGASSNHIMSFIFCLHPNRHLPHLSALLFRKPPSATLHSLLPKSLRLALCCFCASILRPCISLRPN